MHAEFELADLDSEIEDPTGGGAAAVKVAWENDEVDESTPGPSSSASATKPGGPHPLDTVSQYEESSSAEDAAEEVTKTFMVKND